MDLVVTTTQVWLPGHGNLCPSAAGWFVGPHRLEQTNCPVIFTAMRINLKGKNASLLQWHNIHCKQTASGNPSAWP
jgi:hypothetical protein